MFFIRRPNQQKRDSQKKNQIISLKHEMESDPSKKRKKEKKFII